MWDVVFVWLTMLLLALTFWGAVIYTVVHFIHTRAL